MTKNSNFNM